MRRGTDWTVPSVPGLVSDTVAPTKSSALGARRVDLAHEVLVGEEERAKVHRVGVADHGHQQVARPVGASHVDGQPETHVLVAANARRALSSTASTKDAFSDGHRAQPVHDGEGDEVREGDLRAARRATATR